MTDPAVPWFGDEPFMRPIGDRGRVIPGRVTPAGLAGRVTPPRIPGEPAALRGPCLECSRAAPGGFTVYDSSLNGSNHCNLCARIYHLHRVMRRLRRGEPTFDFVIRELSNIICLVEELTGPPPWNENIESWRPLPERGPEDEPDDEPAVPVPLRFYSAAEIGLMIQPVSEPDDEATPRLVAWPRPIAIYTPSEIEAMTRSETEETERGSDAIGAPGNAGLGGGWPPLPVEPNVEANEPDEPGEGERDIVGESMGEPRSPLPPPPNLPLDILWPPRPAASTEGDSAGESSDEPPPPPPLPFAPFPVAAAVQVMPHYTAAQLQAMSRTETIWTEDF